MSDLLLRAAAAAPDEARDAWERWRASHDDLDGADQLVACAAYRNVLRAGVPGGELAPLKSLYRRAWYENQLLLHEAGSVLRALHARGIATLVVKGAAVAVLHYRDIGMRPMGDVDIVVPPGAMSEAFAALDELGWRPVAKRPRSAFVRHSLGFRGGPHRNVDIHWRPLLHDVRSLLAAGSVPVAIGGVDTHAPEPTSQLLIAAVHGSRSRTDVAPAIGVLDVAAIASSSDVDWERLVQLAQELRVSTFAAETIARAADVCPRVPPGVADRLRSMRTRSHERAGFRSSTSPVASRLNGVVEHWDHYRRLRAAGVRGAPSTFPTYLVHAGAHRPAARVAHRAAVAAQLRCAAALPGSDVPVDDLTILAKTFERPATARRLLASIRRWYPDVPVLVVDDSRVPLETADADVLQLPYRTGISYGRNEGLRRVETSLVLLLDDDMVLYAGTGVGRAAAAMHAHPELDIMGGCLLNLPRLRRQPRSLDGPLYRTTATPVRPLGSTVAGFRVAAKVPNFFVGRRERLLEVGWDPELRVGEHAEFFTRAVGRLLTVYNPALRAFHARTPFDDEYMRHRLDLDAARAHLARRGIA